MESLNVFLLIGTGLMFVGLLLGTLSARIGVPSLLVFLVVVGVLEILLVMKSPLQQCLDRRFILELLQTDHLI